MIRRRRRRRKVSIRRKLANKREKRGLIWTSYFGNFNLFKIVLKINKVRTKLEAIFNLRNVKCETF